MSNCPLCERPCDYDAQRMLHNCLCCGKFGITEDLLSDLSGSSKMADFFLSKAKFIAAEKKVKGKDSQGYLIHSWPSHEVDKDTGIWNGLISWDDFIKKFPQNHEIIDRALLNLGNASNDFGVSIVLSDDSKLFSANVFPSELLFSSMSKDHHKFCFTLLTLKEMGLVRYSEPVSSGARDIMITAKGWERIAELKKVAPSESKQIFVAMWFDSDRNDVWEKGIKLGIEGEKDSLTGYTAMRIDGKEHNNKICDEIIVEIRKSRAVIADFTGQRGGVYFEAGFAMGLGIPVVWIVENKDIEKVHFDTRQYNHIVYNNTDELKKALNNRIRATGI